MTEKKSGLAAFKKTTTAPGTTDATATPAAPTTKTGKRKRGEGDRVAVAVRLNKEDWFRLHDFANRQGTTLQGLIIESLSKTMTDRGFPPISGE